MMKLTAILMLVVLQASAISGNAQRVTLAGKNIPLPNLFKEIFRQTGYSFTFSSAAMEKAKPVTLHIQNTPLDEALLLCFKDQPLQFTIIDADKMVVVKQKRTTLPVLSEPPVDLSGKVVDTLGNPLAGISVQVKGAKTGTSTDANGNFSLKGIPENAILVLSGVNVETKEIPVQGRSSITIKVNINYRLEEVVVVNTGYQSLPKERATGSFSTVDAKQLDRRPVADILSKLEGYASGLSFVRNSYDAQPKLVIRGRSTIYANDKPLIVVDGFPIEGDINSINPNDVQNVTILKDAAAASIWGTRAGNGVIVITTKKGKFNQAPTVEIRNQFTMTERPDLFYLPLMSVSDYVDLEQKWFDAGRYNNYYSTPAHRRKPLSDATQTMMDLRNGTITDAAAKARLDDLRTVDVRQQAQDVLYRKGFHSQQVLSVTGGSEWIRYAFSAGYDKDLSQTRGNESDRITIRSDNTIRILPQLNFNVAINSAWDNRENNGIGLEGFQGDSRNGLNTFNNSRYPYFPYQRLKNTDGSAVAIPIRMTPEYNDYLQKKGFLDWSFSPADEISQRDNTAKQQVTRIATGVDYKLLPGLRLDMKYQYERTVATGRNYQSTQLYSTRDVLNRYTAFRSDSTLVHNIPVGDILDLATNTITAHSFRAQADYNKDWNDGRHTLVAVGGMEVRDAKVETRTDKYYGYNDRTLVYSNVNASSSFMTFPTGQSSRIPMSNNFTYNVDRYVSWYSNAAYTYLGRYTLSASGRIDQSNLFGVDRKDRNVPLWSTGAAWNISKEPFFHSEIVNRLKLRATYGFNGNIDKSLTAYPVASSYIDFFLTGLPIQYISNPANPLLQWEKISQFNLAAELSLWNNAVSVNVEYFRKKGDDLLGDMFLDPSSGFATMRANIATMKGSGYDIELNATAGRELQWQTRFLFSHAKDRITDIAIIPAGAFDNGTTRFMMADRQIIPVIGKPVYAVYSFRYAGLDAEGNPQLYDADGKIGSYPNVLNTLPVDKLVYNGPAQPTFFGGWTNTFSWKNFTLSGTITYKFGHYFRKNSIKYDGLNGTDARIPGHADYAQRWQKPGDEQFTNVPKDPGYNTSDQYRDQAWLYSEKLVENASHIRLRDVNLSYDLYRGKKKYFFKSMQVYLYMENLGLLWKANKAGIDPDYVPLTYSTFLPAPFTLTAGFKVEL
jgi:TonB-linked SusC/RagA family outer membrane protein